MAPQSIASEASMGELTCATNGKPRAKELMRLDVRARALMEGARPRHWRLDAVVWQASGQVWVGTGMLGKSPKDVPASTKRCRCDGEIKKTACFACPRR